MKKQPEETADDKMLGKVIAAQLRQQLANAESDCPETETVAAFYDRTLSDAERAMWEAHFLKCLRCQEYLAELARLADADEPPPLLGEQPEADAGKESPGWFYRLAWVIPFLIIGVSSAIWYRDDIQRYLEQRQESAAITSAPALPSGQQMPAAGTKAEEKQTRADKDLAKTAAPAVNGPARSKAVPAREAQGAGIGQAAGQATGAIAVPSARAELSDAAKVAEPAAKSEVAEKRSQNAESVAPAAAAPPVPSSATADTEAGAGAGKPSSLSGLMVRGAQQRIAAQWRVGRRGTIQKANESGGWTRIVSGVDDDLFDITFAGTTGWAVGHGGTVLRSTDNGSTWEKVSAPTTEDLVHVSSQGAQQASVFSRSGKTFTTTDGGQTWKSL